MSIAKSDLESQARNVDGTRRSFSQASYPNLPDLPKLKLKLKLNPNLRRRWRRSISEASNHLNLLSLSDFRKPSLKPKRPGRKPNPNPNPNPRRWGGLISREELGKQCLTELLRIKKEAEQKEEMIRQAQQLLILQDASVTPNTTKEELSASTSEITFTNKELSLPPTFTKEQLSAPPTSEMLDLVYGPDADWIAELQSRNNICGICGCTNHLTSTCSYFEEIPPDAKILNQTIIKIVCKNCGMRFNNNGTCLSKCLPPIRRKAILNFSKDRNKSRKEVIPYPFGKELFVAPPSSEMVLHSSSEETTTPCIHHLSTSPSFKLGGDLDTGLTFPCIPALKS